MLIFHLSLIVPTLLPLNKIKGVTVVFLSLKYAHSRQIGKIKKRHRSPGRNDT